MAGPPLSSLIAIAAKTGSNNDVQRSFDRSFESGQRPSCDGHTKADEAICYRFPSPLKPKSTYGSEYYPELNSDRARLRTTHKAKELLTRAGVIADHAEQAAGGQRGSERVHTA